MHAVTTAVRTFTLLLLLLLVCCCCLYVSAASDGPARVEQQAADREHQHKRTKSASTKPHQRTEDLMARLTPATATIATADTAADKQNSGQSGGVIHKYLVRKPANVFKRLLRSGVDVVQSSMDAFQGVSTRVFLAIKPKTTASRSVPRPPTLLSMTSDEPAAEQSPAAKPRPGIVGRLGNAAASILHTGIAGAEQITDLGFLVGNIGTHKIRAELEGQDGNKEIFNLLVKYAASRVGMSAKGSPRQFVDDIGTISTFMADNENVTKSISTVMECMVNDRRNVIAAMVRIIVTVLESSPSTECVLDQLPLTPSDIRLLFDVFVGSNGQAMMQTIAGLLSSLTTGPDTKEFLESMLSMMSMFKSDDDTAKPASVVGSMTSLFTGGANEEDHDDSEEPKTPQKTFVKRKRVRGGDDKEQSPLPAQSLLADRGKTKPKPSVGADWFNGGSKERTTIQRSVKNNHVGAEKKYGDNDEAGLNVKKTRSKRRKKVKKPRRNSDEDE